MSYVHIISESQWVPLLKCHRTVFLLILNNGGLSNKIEDTLGDVARNYNRAEFARLKEGDVPTLAYRYVSGGLPALAVFRGGQAIDTITKIDMDSMMVKIEEHCP